MSETKKKILIIEDNEINREILECILTDEYEVLKAENGEAGLKLLKEYGNEISLILLDIQMPIMNGYEFLEAVKQDEKHAGIPIIVTTAGDVNEDQIKCLSMGASDYVLKPYNPEVVKRRIEGLIRLCETAALLHKVERDKLTGLYNKDAFCTYADKMLKSNPDNFFDVICFEIESFKLLHSRYGSENCKAIIKSLASNLSRFIPQDALIGRIDEAQFAVLIKHSDFENYKDFSEICKLSSAPIPNVKINCGIYSGIEQKLSIGDILNNTLLLIDNIRYRYDKYIAKFDEEFREKINREQLLNSSAKDAIKGKQFKVYYQPKHDVSTGNVSGAEALVRWIHPELGFINPGDFIPLFESNGFVYEIDTYVLETVCSHLRNWLDAGKKAVPVSVNLSQVDFDRTDLAGKLERIVDSYNIPHDLIHFEITESAEASDKEKKLESVNEFKEKGFEVELDDFGAGYSTLAILSELPTDIMKIDMSLIRNMFNPKNSAILKGVLYTAASLKYTVVAEGVETKEQLNALNEMCDGKVKLYIQGYFFSKPLPREQFEEYLSKNYKQRL